MSAGENFNHLRKNVKNNQNFSMGANDDATDYGGTASENGSSYRKHDVNVSSTRYWDLNREK